MGGDQPACATEGRLTQLSGERLVIRADAGVRIGTGHLMRCLALAQGWRDRGGLATFITACEGAGLLQRLSTEGFQVIRLEQSYRDVTDWRITSKALAEWPGVWVVLDGYHFDATYQRRVKELGHPLLVIDDMAHLDHYYADILLNQNTGSGRLHYSCEPNTRLLLGTRYALMRSEFLAWRGWRRRISEVARRILVTLGGSDPGNQTSKVVRALEEIEVEGLDALVVAGASNPSFRELQSAVRDSSVAIRLKRHLTSMVEAMAWADTAVSAGGSTCWELAFMGLPNVILQLADNQRESAEALDTYGVALNLGWYANVSEPDVAQTLEMLIVNRARRRVMSERGQRLVDGGGVGRVLAAMDRFAQATAGGAHLQIRPAHAQDTELLWQWANDPTVRANSFHPESIPLDEHMRWYGDKLASPDTRIWILELDRMPVAQIRYDLSDDRVAEISLSVAQEYRGRGLGTRMLVLTSPMACEELGARQLRGVVLMHNEASARAFVKSGFRYAGDEEISGRLCQVFVRECLKSVGDVG